MKRSNLRHRKSKLVDILGRSELEIRSGAEVGVQFANTAVHLLANLPHLHLYLVDSYEAGNWLRQTHTIQEAQKVVECKLEPFKDRTTWLLMRSVEAAKQIGDRSLDYTFIDADHSYEAVKEDIEAWLPKIRPGGILAGHDYCRRFPGVMKAVDERFGDKRNRWGSIWWVHVSEVRGIDHA